MFLIKTAFLELSRKKIKTLILGIVFVIVFTGELGALTILFSAREARKPILAGIGATVTLEWAPEYEEEGGADGNIFTEEAAAQMASAEYIVGVNQKCSDYVLPVDFKNCRQYQGEDPYVQEVRIDGMEAEMEEWVALEGDDRIDLIDAFRLGGSTLAEGEFPSSAEPGALVSRQLAEENGLAPGSRITFSAYGKSLTLAVSGIYETKSSFTVTAENIVGPAVFAYSPYNRIYADADTVSDFFDINKETLPIDAYVDEPGHVQAAGEEIKAMDFDWSVYRLVNTTATQYSEQANNIEAVIYTANMFFMAMSVFSAIALVLTMSIWAAQFPYEGGICLALGGSKWFAVAKLFVSSLCIAVFALAVSLPFSSWLAGGIIQAKNDAAKAASGIHSTFVTGVEPVSHVVLARPDAGLLACFVLTALAVVLASCLLPLYTVFRLKPREILSGREV